MGLATFIQNVSMLEELQTAPNVTVGVFMGRDPVTTVSGLISNTSLSKTEGLLAGTPGDILIWDNPKLETVDLLPSQILLQYNTSYTGNLQIINNGASVRVDTPVLLSVAGTMTLGNCSELSIPSLFLVNGSMEMVNASFSSLSAPALERIKGNLNTTGAFS